MIPCIAGPGMSGWLAYGIMYYALPIHGCRYRFRVKQCCVSMCAARFVIRRAHIITMFYSCTPSYMIISFIIFIHDGVHRSFLVPVLVDSTRQNCQLDVADLNAVWVLGSAPPFLPRL